MQSCKYLKVIDGQDKCQRVSDETGFSIGDCTIPKNACAKCMEYQSEFGDEPIGPVVASLCVKTARDIDSDRLSEIFNRMKPHFKREEELPAAGPCNYRNGLFRKEPCKTCRGLDYVEIYECELYDLCSPNKLNKLSPAARDQIVDCRKCSDLTSQRHIDKAE